MDKIAERDYRLDILNTLLWTPHGDVTSVVPIFQQVHQEDPLFFGRLACWYVRYGSVRDLKELFIAHMCVSNFDPAYREAGLAMLSELAPFQVANVLCLIKGWSEGDRYYPGIASGVPRSFRSAVKAYLQKREAQPEQFDNVVLHARKALKTLYASLRIKPGPYAQALLFDDNPPQSSRLYALKAIARERDPATQAALVVEHKIPYRVAASVLRQLTPSALGALVSSMTPQEVINNLASLKRRGVMDNADLRALVESKLHAAQSDNRVAALKSRRALEAANLDEDLSGKVAAVADAQIKAKGTMRKPTALLIDRSHSMDVAIEAGKQIAAILAPVCQADLFVYAFNSLAYPIVAKGNELSDWDRAFKGITATGTTSCGVAIKTMQKKQQRVEQIIIVTDQEENTAPYFVSALQEYADWMSFAPNVIVIHVGNRGYSNLEAQLANTRFQWDAYTFAGDYYSLPSLIPLLCGGSRLDLLIEIMEMPLPTREHPALRAAQTASVS